MIVESVNIVLTPKGRNEWTNDKDTINTDQDLRKKFLDKFTSELFNDLIVSINATENNHLSELTFFFLQKAKEVIESEQGMFTRMATRTIDNLQVQI